MLEIFLPLIVSIFLIVLASSIVVNSIVEFSQKTRISTLFVTFFSVTLGNILPEFVTSIFLNINNLGSVSLANILSNVVVDLTIILGICVLFSKKVVTERRYVLVTFLIIFLLLCFVVDKRLSSLEGVILFLTYPLLFLYFYSKELPKEQETKVVVIDVRDILKYFFVIPFGIAVIVVNSFVLISVVKVLLKYLKMSPDVIGFLLGILSSSPELSISIVSIVKKRSEIMIGNLLGTVVVDLTFALGVVSAIKTVCLHRLKLVYLQLLICMLSCVLLSFVEKHRKVVGISLMTLFLIFFVIFFI